MLSLLLPRTRIARHECNLQRVTNNAADISWTHGPVVTNLPVPATFCLACMWYSSAHLPVQQHHTHQQCGWASPQAGPHTGAIAHVFASAAVAAAASPASVAAAACAVVPVGPAAALLPHQRPAHCPPGPAIQTAAQGNSASCFSQISTWRLRSAAGLRKFPSVSPHSLCALPSCTK